MLESTMTSEEQTIVPLEVHAAIDTDVGTRPVRHVWSGGRVVARAKHHRSWRRPDA